MFGLNETVQNRILSNEELLLNAKKVVARYVAKNSIPRREEEDVTMAIVEKFLLKKSQIISRFKGESKFSTYCFAVMNRMCCEVIRSQKKDWNLSENQEAHDVIDTLSQTDLLLIKEETLILQRILFLFGHEKSKLELFFAFFFKLQILEMHLFNYEPDYLKLELVKIFLIENNCSKGEIYSILTEVVNLVEKKNMKPDAVRMWMNKCRTIIIDRLNINSLNNGYDNDSFQALFEINYQSEISEELVPFEF